MAKSLHRMVLVSVMAMIGIIGCGRPPVIMMGESVAVEPAAQELSSADLAAELAPDIVAKLNDAGEVVIIDVREDWEYQEGHIPGATLIPLGSLPDRISEIPSDVPVVLVCRSGNRSGQAFRFLTQKGLDNVHNMKGGMLAWQDAGLGIDP